MNKSLPLITLMTSDLSIDTNTGVRASKTGIASRVTRGVGALSLNAAVSTLGQLTIVPIALYSWGKLRYGEWVVLSGLVTFLRLTDLGLQTFVVNRICASYARGDREEMQRSLSSALRVQIPLVFAVLVFIALALSLFPIQQALALQTVSRMAFSLVAMMLVMELLLGVPMGVVAGVYRATGRLARGGVIGACQQFGITALTITLIASHADFVSLAAVRLGIALLVSVWILFDLNRLYPWLHLWPGEGDWRLGARMIGPGLFFMLIPLADYLSTQFSLVILQHSNNGGEVSRLATHRTVVNLAVMASGLLTNAVWPELTALHARNESNQLIKTHRSLARINMWLVAAVTIGMLPFVPLIYPSWTAGRLTIDSWTLGLLITRILLWGIWSASMTVLCAVNKQKAVACVLLGSACITCILSIVLIPRIGISGAALAQLIGDVSITAWLIPLLASREIGDSFRKLVVATARALFLGILVPVALGLIGWRLIHAEAIRLIVLVPTILLLAFGLMWKQLPSYERSHLFSLVKTRFAQS
jgi:O-antigen/teichoic acid export membrane protein